MQRSPIPILLIVIGVLAFFAVRLHRLDAIPLFIDEAIAIERSENIRDGVYLQHARTGKFLLPYYLLPFQAQLNAAWISRASFLILCCLGFAAAVAIANRYGGLKAALLAAMALVFSPALFFFDRLVLADTMLHVALGLWIWSLFAVFDRPRFGYRRALFSAALYVVALLAKAPALFFLPLPVVFAWALPRWSIGDRLRSLLALYGAIAALWLPFALVIASRGIDFFAKSAGLSSSNALFDSERIGNNLSALLDMFSAYDGGGFILVAAFVCLAGVFRRPRPLLPLLAGIVGYEFALIWLGGDALFNRYFLPVYPLFIASAAIALADFSQLAPRRFKRGIFPLIVGLLLIWIASQSAPFIQALRQEPASADLAPADWGEYVGRNSSGFGIPELSSYLSELSADGAIAIEGAVVGCYTLRLYVADADKVLIQCPNVLSGERRAAYLNARLPQQANIHERYYLLLETGGLVSREELTTVPLQLQAEFPRPGNLSKLQLYAVTR